MRHSTLAFCAFLFTLPASAAERADLVLADFEGADYGKWKAKGEAFGPGPARGTLPGQMPVSGYLGKGLVNTFFKGDRTTGTLTSPPFAVERRYVNFLIGGGDHAGETCMNLLVAGKVVRTATGPPGGSERLDWQTWDVGEFAGKKAILEIVDRHTGGWGHVNVDQIVQSDTRKAAGPASREVAVTGRYLHLPVKNGARKRRMRLVVGGKVVREFTIELADDKPDWWAFADVSAFGGKRLKVEVDALPEGSKGLSAITQGDELKGAGDLYREKYRPQIHFSSRRGWNNDPNGLVYHGGKWHLFYQHNPYGIRWGNMHWGHAVSKDLVHWKELPVALYPRRFGDWAFSGSAVVDSANTAGFRKGKEAPIVLAYTSTGRGECLAYSTDGGKTFAEYDGNPVVRHRGRDPKVIWHAPTKRWVMAVYDEKDRGRYIAFYTSPDLKKWTFRSRIEGYFECPEIFELPVDGKEGRTKWVVYAADGNYAIGSFDGERFTRASGKHRGNWGNCLYAAQTWNNAPDGRRVQIGWARVDLPGMPFNQMMTFPVELSLRTTKEGVRLFANPVREIEKLHGKEHSWKGKTFAEGETPLEGLAGDLFHIRATFAVGGAKEFGLVVRGIPITVDVAGKTLTCRKQKAPLQLRDGKVELEVLVDRTSLEVFADGGRVYMPLGAIPAADKHTLAVFSRGGATRALDLTVHELRPAWE
jgi:fructan beta-fructosidase